MFKTIEIIKTIKKLDVDKKTKNKIIALGILEEILSSYKIILALPFNLLNLIFRGIQKIGEIGDAGTYFILQLIEHIPDIRVAKQEDVKYLNQKLREYYNKHGKI